MDSKMYDLFNKESIDPNKKNIIVFLMDQTLKKEIYSVTYQYIFNTLKILSDDFNLIIVTKNGGTKWTENYINHEEFGNYAYLTFDKERKYGSSNAQQMNHAQRIVYINETFKELEMNEPDLFKNLAGTLSSQFIVPSLDINYEIISDDEKLLHKQKRSIEKFQEGLLKNKLVSHCAFIHKPLGFPIELMVHLMKNYQDIWHYGFCHDTGSTWLHFKPEYNPFTNKTKCFYFVDDKRSVRDFTKFPLTELQDFYGKDLKGKDYYDSILDNKGKDFLFGGLFPFEIEYRTNAWYRFFHNLDVNGTIRTQTNGKPAVSTKNSLLKAKEQKFPKKYQDNQEIENFIEDILSNKMVQDTVSYEEYNNELKDSLFTIVLKCYYGKYCSLNFRVINSLFYGTIPLIDDTYDTDYLQIPKHIKDKIVVSNHKDIEDKVKYYREHPNEYRELFYTLFNYFIDKKFFDESYYRNEFKKEFFSELY